MRIAVLPVALLSCALFAQAPDQGQARRAQEALAAGKAGEAIRIYQDLLANSPRNPILLMNLCVAEYTDRHYRDAVLHATAALQLQPDLLPARLFLGASQLELGDFAEAILSLRLVVSANPRERNARVMLGEALLKAGRPAEALEELRAAAEMLPDNPRVWYGLGRAHEALGQTSRAHEAWGRLAALPPSLEQHLHAAEVLSAGQRWREAVPEWQEALRMAPEKAAIRVGLGEALFRSRDYPAAMAALQPLLGGESDGAEAKFLYGASLLNLQQPVDAIPLLRAAIARDPGLLPARAALGQALLQTGNAPDAIPLLEAALSVDQDGSIHFQLFRAYQLSHRDAEAQRARADYRRFRESLAARP